MEVFHLTLKQKITFLSISNVLAAFHMLHPYISQKTHPLGASMPSLNTTSLMPEVLSIVPKVTQQ